MNKKIPSWILKIISISIGFTGSFIILEIWARLLPASDYFPSELPLICKNPIYPDKNCIFRRSPNKMGHFTKGEFPPFNISVKKRTNDLGQFSNINFETIKVEDSNFKKVISIGDSFVEALQIPNEKTFHGRLNNYVTESGKYLISTSIGSSGNALPQFLTHLFYLNKNIDLKSSVVIFTIVVNDFDESLEKFLIHKGAYFSNENPLHIGFKERLPNNNIKLKRGLISSSALARYLFFNIRFDKKLNSVLCKANLKNCDKFKTLGSNLVYSEKEVQKERFIKTKISSNVFLKYISNLRNSKLEKKNTLFIIDTHRENIYDINSKKDYYFDFQREYFMKEAKKMGFTVVDMDKIFRNHFKINKKRFEFINDGHWNSIAHKIITEEIANILALKKINEF